MSDGLSLQDMRDLTRKGLGGLNEQDISDPEVDQILNLSYWELESRFPFLEKQYRTSFILVPGQETYDIETYIETPDDVFVEAFQSFGMMGDPTSSSESEISYAMQRMTEDWYDSVYSERTDVQTRPTHFLRRDKEIVFWHIPDKAYVCRVFLLKTLKSLLYREIETPNLPREWHELVVEGAITRGHYYTQDYNLAQQAENFRVSKIRTAVPQEGKEEEDSRYAGLIVQWDNPDDGPLDPNVASDDPYFRGSSRFWNRRH